MGQEAGKYDSASAKWLLRYEISVRVMQVIENMGSLYTIMRFTGLSSESNNTYATFIDSFFKLFHEVGLFTKDAELLADIEKAFKQEDISMTPENVNLFMDLFEEFLVQMKEAGVYDPIVTRYFNQPEASWEKST
ncbi:MAG: hypothetical protein KAR39_13160 [Thermoplasmata archaeon]|nr:hypothetical protein [Thermoplasmata archaeon]